MSNTDRKQAFLQVLAANIDGNVRQEIMHFWEEKYAARPQFGVSAFLDEVYSKYSLTVKKGQLFRQLSRAVMQAGGAAKPGGQENSSADIALSECIDQNGLKVFHALLTEFAALAKPADSMKIANAQFEGAQQVRDGDSGNVTKMAKWLRSGSAAIPDKMELSVLKKVFNAGYVEACQLYGPVKADQMLNAALQKTGNLPEAHLTAPVHFI